MIRGPLKFFGIYASFLVVFGLSNCSDDPAFKVAEEAAPQGVSADVVMSDEQNSEFNPLIICSSVDGVSTRCNVGDPNDPGEGGGLSGGGTDPGGQGSNPGTGGNPGNEGNEPGNEGGNPGGGGSDPQPQYALGSDSFVQDSDADKKLDILVVVDNSGSMKEEQENLAPKLTRLLDFADKADWRIGVRTTDGGHLGVALVVDKNDSSKTFEQKKTQLKNTIQGFGINGSGNEQGIPMAVRGLGANIPGTNSKWVRPDSMVAVLIVSDEDNCSNGQGCNGNLNEASYLLDYLSVNSSSSNIGRVLGETAKVYGLIRRSASECTQALNVGYKYMDAILGSNGLAGRICDEDYTNTLSAMSADLGTTLKLAFELSHVPVVTSIEVKIDGQAYTGGLLVNSKTVQLSDAPPPGAFIEINYQYLVE